MGIEKLINIRFRSYLNEGKIYSSLDFIERELTKIIYIKSLTFLQIILHLLLRDD